MFSLVTLDRFNSDGVISPKDKGALDLVNVLFSCE
jgi:hypothetical protein